MGPLVLRARKNKGDRQDNHFYGIDFNLKFVLK
jgi:hypothetical protein